MVKKRGKIEADTEIEGDGGPAAVGILKTVNPITDK